MNVIIITNNMILFVRFSPWGGILELAGLRLGVVRIGVVNCGRDALMTRFIMIGFLVCLGCDGLSRLVILHG